MHWLGNRQAWLVCAAVLMGGCAYLLAHRFLRGQEAVVQQRLAGQFATRDALVAARSLPAGATLEPAMLARRAVPERFLPSDAFGAEAAAVVLGRKLARPFQGGETLSASALEAETIASLSSLVDPGQRALTIPVDESSAAAGLLAPGDLVDLLWVRRNEEAGASAASVQPLLQAVRVVATGQQLQRHRPGATEEGAPAADTYATITLHVRPEEAERILLAQRLGELAIILRPASDSEPASLPTIDVSTLLGASARAAHRGRRASRSIEFIIGGLGSPLRAHSNSQPSALRVQP
jgi:pilus assembly protein CpaB